MLGRLRGPCQWRSRLAQCRFVKLSLDFHRYRRLLLGHSRCFDDIGFWPGDRQMGGGVCQVECSETQHLINMKGVGSGCQVRGIGSESEIWFGGWGGSGGLWLSDENAWTRQGCVQSRKAVSVWLNWSMVQQHRE